MFGQAWTIVFLIGFVLLGSALWVERSGIASGDYDTFERHAVLAHRLMFASILLLPLEVALVAPLAALLIVALIGIWALWWLPLRHRRLDVGATTVFEADPAAVASVMFDIAGQPRWIEGLVENVLLTPGLVRVGSAIRQTVLVRGHRLVARATVTELRPYERMVIAVQLRHGAPFDVLEVAPHARGALVRYAGVHELRWVTAILSGWNVGAFRRQFTERRAAHLERLRHLVERRPALAQARP